MKKEKIIRILMIISCILVILVGSIYFVMLIKFNGTQTYEDKTTKIEETTTLNICQKETQIVEICIVESVEATTQEEFLSKEDEMNLRILEINSSLGEMEWFKEYKRITDEYKDYPDVQIPETIYDAYHEDEIDIMLSCIETEVYTGDFMSKCNVASVIFNRVYNKKFPNNPIDVITAPYQFAYGRTKITESTRLALEYVYIFGDTTNGCISFRSDKKPTTWYGWKYQFTDTVGHNFYR